MNLIIVTTRHDPSVVLLEQEVKKIGAIRTIFYEDLLLINGQIFEANNVPLKLQKSEKLILRWPWVIRGNFVQDFNVLIKVFVEKFSAQIALDKICLEKYSPFYEDKLFQSTLFSHLGIPTPSTFFAAELQDFKDIPLSFPLVFKKRVSSRGKNNFLMKSKNEIIKKAKNQHLDDYILQEYVKADQDIRVIVLKGKVIGSIGREMFTRDGGRLAVKGAHPMTDVSKEILNNCITASSYLGADFVGFDVLVGKNSYYFIEANVSPQFIRFEKTTGIHLAEQVIQSIFKG